MQSSPPRRTLDPWFQPIICNYCYLKNHPRTCQWLSKPLFTRHSGHLKGELSHLEGSLTMVNSWDDPPSRKGDNPKYNQISNSQTFSFKAKWHNISTIFAIGQWYGLDPAETLACSRSWRLVKDSSSKWIDYSPTVTGFWTPKWYYISKIVAIRELLNRFIWPLPKTTHKETLQSSRCHDYVQNERLKCFDIQ